MKKTELWVTIVGLVGAVLAVVMESALITEGSLPYIIMGGVATVISYVTGRSYVKGQEAKTMKIAQDLGLKTKLPPLEK